MQFDSQKRIGAQVARQFAQALLQVASLEALRAQVEDVVADVANHVVQIVDDLVDPLVRLLRRYLHLILRIFQHQADGIDGLDDAVVQVHAKALALFQYRELLRLKVQLCVLNGDGGLRGEHLQHLLILVVEDGPGGSAFL